MYPAVRPPHLLAAQPGGSNLGTLVTREASTAKGLLGWSTVGRVRKNGMGLS